MKKFSILFLSITAIWSLSSSALFGAALVLALDSGGFLLQNNGGSNLPFGDSTTQRDGAIIQVGYFSGANSDNNNFSGTFIPFTGEGSLNFVNGGAFDTTVGDGPSNLNPKNQFQISINVDSALTANYPAVGTIMSVRIFSNISTSAAALPADRSTHFMTLSSNLWKWPVATTLTDPNSRLDISLSDDFLRVENRSGAGNLVSTPSGDAVNTSGVALRTATPVNPVPEPSCSLLALAGCVAFLTRRRK